MAVQEGKGLLEEHTLSDSLLGTILDVFHLGKVRV